MPTINDIKAAVATAMANGVEGNRILDSLQGVAEEIERLRDVNESLRQDVKWRSDERERAFAALGADDYPDGDLVDWIERRLSKHDDLLAEIQLLVPAESVSRHEAERLQAIVAKLPTTADGVPVVPEMKLFAPSTCGGDVFSVDVLDAIYVRYPDNEPSEATASRFSSTREAARAERDES